MTDPRLRHIPYTHPYGQRVFGHHYITNDPTMPTAEQFDITVFPHGDNTLSADDPMRDTPHILIRTFDEGTWQDVSRSPIGRE